MHIEGDHNFTRRKIGQLQSQIKDQKYHRLPDSVKPVILVHQPGHIEGNQNQFFNKRPYLGIHLLEICVHL